MRTLFVLALCLCALALVVAPTPACGPGFGASFQSFGAVPYAGGCGGVGAAFVPNVGYSNFGFNAGFAGGYGANVNIVHGFGPRLIGGRVVGRSFSGLNAVQLNAGGISGANVNIVNQQRGGLLDGLFGGRRNTQVIQATAGGLGGANVNIVNGGRRR